PFTPIIMVTAMADSKDVVAGLEAGGDDYLTKPVDQQALVARVRSMLRIKALHDTVQAQTAELARWNATLEERVARQVAELERVGRLKRFFSPQLAALIVRGGGASAATSCMPASASPRATRPSAPSASRAAWTTAPSGPSPISPSACARRRPPGRFSSVRASTPPPAT